MRSLIAALVLVALVPTARLHAAGRPVPSTFWADVPRSHPAYACISAIARKVPFPMGYPDGTFGGKRAMTRYEFAVSVARMVPRLEAAFRPPDIDGRPPEAMIPLAPGDFACLTRLAEEFRPELEFLQVNVADVKASFARLEAEPRMNAKTLFAGKPGRAFDEVPAGDPAYAAVASLAAKYPSVLVCVTPEQWPAQATSRYEFAVITALLLASVQSSSDAGPRPVNLQTGTDLYESPESAAARRRPRGPALTDAQAALLDGLITRFQPELDALRDYTTQRLGVKPAGLHRALKAWVTPAR